MIIDDDDDNYKINIYFKQQNIYFYFPGITTVLTMTFLGLEARTDLPKVPYPTALDFFVFLSFAFIFATIIQVTKSCMITLVTQYM